MLENWKTNFFGWNAANFGWGADRVENILWRLQNGELDGIKPRAVVLMIGTNNTGLECDQLTPCNTPDEVVAGVTAIVQGLRTQLPQAKILLLAIFPRGASRNDPQRVQINGINAALARLADGKCIHFFDIGPKFLEPDGSLTAEIMPDFLHPGPKGYKIWADAIEPDLAKLIGPKP